MGTLIELYNLEIGYEGKALTVPIRMQIEQGEFWSIVGPNGSGKTTLLKTLLGLLPPVKGAVVFPSKKPPAFGYVPQAGTIDSIYPVTAKEVVELGRAARSGIFRRRSKKDRDSIQKALEQTQVDAYANQPYRELSGGQKQRTLIARALATDPEILLLDEPISGMDLAGEKSTMDFLQSLSQKQNLAIIMISHALSVVANYAKKLILLDSVNRKVLFGSIEEVLRPEKLQTLYGFPVAVEEVKGWKSVFAKMPSKSPPSNAEKG